MRQKCSETKNSLVLIAALVKGLFLTSKPDKFMII